MTIYDIAKEAGVSASTVSRVINDKPGIKAATREKVMEIVRKYNFAPDETARGLVKQATKTIGLLVADVRIINYMMGVHDIIKELAQMGYCCIVLDTGVSDEERAEYIKILGQRRVEGAILIGAGYACSEVENAISAYLGNIPVMMVNSSIDLPNVYSVFCDEQQGAELCFDYIFESGFSKPVYISCSSAGSYKKKLAGIAASVAKHKPGLDVPDYRGDDPLVFGYEETRKALEEHPDTDVLIYSSDCYARKGMQALYDMGISVPGQMSVISAEGSVYSEFVHPYITYIDTKITTVCGIACSNMVALLAGNEVPHKVVITPKLSVGETVKS